MRIALVSQEYPPETAKGGLGTQTFVKAHGLAAQGHEVLVLSRSPDGTRTERRDGRVTVIRIPGRERSMSLHTEVADWLTYSVEVAAAIEAWHARRPLDLVDLPEWAAEGYVHLLNRTAWNWVPTVVQLHGPLVMLAHTLGWPDRDSEFYRVGSAMEHTCLRLADAVFSSSRCSAEWCARHYGLALETTPILHTGVDTEWFQPRAVPQATRPTILFVGRLVPNKGVRLLVDAAGRLAREFPDLRLRLLGRGEPAFVDELRARAAVAGLKNGVDLPGLVTRAELPDHLSRAHVFAAPSRYEGGPGFVYLEAMACGLPVVACSGSGAAEVVHHEETGLLVPPDDLEALVAALRRLLGDGTTRRALGERARRYVLEKADSRVCLRELERFYAGVLARGAGRAANR